MLIKDYGFKLSIDDKKIVNPPFKYLAKEMIKDNSIISLLHYGETIADVGFIWESNNYFRFDAYKPIIKGSIIIRQELQIGKNKDICEILINWAAEQAKQYEMPEYSQAILDLLNLTN